MDTVTYSVRIKHYNAIFKQTLVQYRHAADFFINVINENWDIFSLCASKKEAVNTCESLTVKTKKNPSPKYHFTKMFVKFPSYLRRCAIAFAYGHVKSYHSNLANWENTNPSTRGKAPQLGKAGYICPAMYRDNCFIRTGTYTARVKVFIRNTWDWLDIKLKKGDVDYINHHCASFKACVPTLRHRGKIWSLDFAFQYKTELHHKPIKDQIVLGVDLGINNACCCSAMRSDGTVIGRKFLSLPKEYDCLNRKLNRIKRAQRHGAKHLKRLWQYADGTNADIEAKTAGFIIETAKLYHCDTIVMEHLEFKGKVKGSKRQRLALWRKQGVQRIVENRAHRFGMRFARVCAWNTSRLAFDGSGRVKRGKASDRTGGSYSVCEFTTGKIYNCDLNASYNIGARHLIREHLKSLPVTERQRILAKVPACDKRSTCVLSNLISLYSVLYPSGKDVGVQTVSLAS